MANPIDLMGALNAYSQSIQAQREQLMQPAPQQGGFLSGADPVMLSLAAGLLSPTKAGSFGESVGAGLSAAAGPLSEIRKQEQARADKLAALNTAEAKMKLDFYEAQQGIGRGRADDPSLVIKRYEDMALGYDELAATPGLKKTNPDAYNKAILRAEEYRQKADQIRGFSGEEEPSRKPKPIPTGQTEEGTPAPSKKEEAGKTTAKPYTGDKPPASYPNAKKGKHGYWYVPIDPNNPSKGYQYVAE